MNTPTPNLIQAACDAEEEFGIDELEKFAREFKREMDVDIEEFADSGIFGPLGSLEDQLPPPPAEIYVEI